MSASRSAGRAQPTLLRGRVFDLVGDCPKLFGGEIAQLASMFSLMPRCHGECASQKYTFVPVSSVICRCSASSLPWSRSTFGAGSPGGLPTL